MLKTGQFAQTLKVGGARGWGKKKAWVVSPYYSSPSSDAGTQTQYIHNAGIDITWFPARWQKSSSSAR
jgi:hypothetical protein